jgi:hypothetical protein
MRRRKKTLLRLASLLAFAPLAFSQQGSAQPCPAVTPGTLGCQLVAWSRLQEPVPLPEPETKPAPDQQPGKSQDSRTQTQASRQRVMGIIVRQGEKYVLKAGDSTTYQLDDQGRAGLGGSRQTGNGCW